MEEELKGTAYHEAGHAVAHWLLRLPFERISIIPKDDSLGHVKLGRFPDSFNPDWDDSAKTRQRVEKHIMVYFAGVIAEARYAGQEEEITEEFWRRGSSDVQNLISFADYVTGGPEETEAYVHWLFERTRNMIRLPVNWPIVEALAAALLEEKELSARKARRIMREAQAALIRRQ